MSFEQLHTTAISRRLAQVADGEGDLADVYFERRERVELPPADEALGLRVWQEQGLAVRLVRGGHSWLASRDSIDASSFQQAVRQVARALPAASYPGFRLEVEPPRAPVEAGEVQRFPAAVQRLLKERLVGFPLRLTVRRHRRWLRVVGTELAGEPQSERFYSCQARMPWGRHGVVLRRLDPACAAEMVDGLVELFRARDAPPPPPGRHTVVLSPQAAAVLLHEAVAHALETDTLALGGRPEAAVGVRIGPEHLAVLDDPAALPEPIRRTCDDEGMPVVRRWLVRAGTVEQPLADRYAASTSASLIPGAGRRGGRHQPPVPRSTHLEVVAGEAAEGGLMAAGEGGLYAPLAERGALDPLRGDFSLQLPVTRRIRDGRPQEYLGPARLEGRVAELLGAVAVVGDKPRFAGAGWCAKGGQRMAVWATVPELLLEGVRLG